MEIVAQRAFSPLYIWLDTAFLVVFALLLFFSRRRLTLLWALFGGVLYFAVDFGIFHLLTGSRSIEGGSMFWVLLWMSMSYGMTNFAWIWLCLRRDERLTEWTLLIFLWWIACPMLADTFGAGLGTITISRTTGAYHGWMALVLILSYLAVIVYNLCVARLAETRVRILRLFVIGVAVQFGWEFSLLVGGIRSAGIEDVAEKLRVLVVNSLVETNLGMPAMYLIFLWLTAAFNEDLRPARKPNRLTLKERLVLDNAAARSRRPAPAKTKEDNL